MRGSRGSGPERTRLRPRTRSVPGAVAGLAAATALTLVAGCTSGDGQTPRTEPTQSSSSPTGVAAADLTFGVYGPRDEVEAFQSTVDAWNNGDRGHVELRDWSDHDAMRRDLRSGDLPDVFMISRADLSWLLERRLTTPVDELLDERGIDFGDDYSRDSISAFSVDDRLQCMPYGVSPMVIYYNKDLVDFDRMRRRGLDVPEPDATSWSFDQFVAATRFASNPRQRTKGVHIAPTLSGLTPFIRSGGGSVFDDDVEPTSLEFSSDETKAALERTLQLLRKPQLTLDVSQLAKASPVRWFERGKLGMIAGYRSLVPQLRRVSGLRFDVMPMPVLDSSATVGDVTGFCISADAASIPVAADFLVHELSVEALGRITRTGYLDPANLQVALTNDFLQVGREPEHSAFFNSSVRSMSLPPLTDRLSQLERVVAPRLRQLVYGVGLLDLDFLTQQIDLASQRVLAPESASPSASDDGSPTESPSESDSPSG